MAVVNGSPPTLPKPSGTSPTPTSARFVANLRWPNGAVCPSCGGRSTPSSTTRRLWKCGRARSSSPSRSARSSRTRRSAWTSGSRPCGWSRTARTASAPTKSAARSASLRRPRGSCSTESGSPCRPGPSRSCPARSKSTRLSSAARPGSCTSARKPEDHRTGGTDKAAVIGVLERGGNVRAAGHRRHTAQHLARPRPRHVEPGASVYTDALTSLQRTRQRLRPHNVDHAEAYVGGKVHTNGIENFWALLKRGITAPTSASSRSTCSATWTSACSRSTCANSPTSAASRPCLRAVAGRRLTYLTLTGKA